MRAHCGTMPSASSSSASAKKGQLTATEKRIYQAALSSPNNAISQAEVENRLSDARTEDVLAALNGLLKKSLLNLQNTERGPQYVAVTKSEASIMGALTGDESIIYRHIKDAGNEGIWLKILKSRTNIHDAVITRCLKALQNRQLVKQVASVNHKKIYMLYHLTPAATLSGGPWYTDNELDTAFILGLSNVCLQYIQQESWPPGYQDGDTKLYPSSYTRHLPTAPRVLQHLQDKGVTAVKLSVEDVQALLETLVYDEKIEKVPMLGAMGGGGPGAMAPPTIEDDDGDDAGWGEDARSSKKRKSSSSKKKSSKKKSSSRDKKKRRGRRHSSSESDDSESESESESEDSSASDSESATSSSDDGRAKKRRRGSSRSKSSRSRSRSKSKSRSSKSKKSRRSRSKSRATSSEDESSDASESESEEESESDDEVAVKSRKSNSKKAKSRVLTPEPALDMDDDDGGEVGLDASLYVYRALRPAWAPPGFTETPCARCPVFDFCRPNGPVNAEDCVYFDQWIQGALEESEDEDGGEDGWDENES